MSTTPNRSRGWGSKWPGHFLPTDLMNKWTVRTAKSNGIYTSQKLEDVVPDLPEGWEWVEEEWRVDLSGTASGTTDANGWSYALDFSRNVVFPFPPGSGKAKLSDFVRTRRWLRTRVLPPQDDLEDDGDEVSGGQNAEARAAGTGSNSKEDGRPSHDKRGEGHETRRAGQRRGDVRARKCRRACPTTA